MHRYSVAPRPTSLEPKGLDSDHAGHTCHPPENEVPMDEGDRSDRIRASMRVMDHLDRAGGSPPPVSARRWSFFGGWECSGSTSSGVAPLGPGDRKSRTRTAGQDDLAHRGGA